MSTNLPGAFWPEQKAPPGCAWELYGLFLWWITDCGQEDLQPRHDGDSEKIKAEMDSTVEAPQGLRGPQEVHFASCEYGSPHQKEFAFLSVCMNTGHLHCKCRRQHRHIRIEGKFAKPMLRTAMALRSLLQRPLPNTSTSSRRSPLMM